jgi:glycosyltransferase involved in cell wall biosynthesis
MSSWPRITIITPSFNQGEFLEDTILSILNQKYPNLEYFVVDGGSTDNTLDIIKKYEDSIDWWVSEPDRGQSHAINKGLERATGDLINWINSDDLLFPDALQHMALGFINNPEADLFIGETARIDLKGHIRSISAPPSILSFSSKYYILPIGQQSTFFTAKVVKKVNKIREDLHMLMDYDFYYRILSLNVKYKIINQLIGAIREHPLAKGYFRKDLCAEESARYRNSAQDNGLKQLTVEWIIKFLRVLDGSILRGKMLTMKLNGKKISGHGWSGSLITS